MGKNWRSSKRIGFFDLIAPIYDRLFHPALNKFCRQGGFIKDGFILDIGGGTGRIASSLHDGNQKFLIADLSIRMMLQSRQYPHVLPMMADGGLLPLRDESMQAVLIADAYHHFQNRELVLKEVRRALYIKGNLYIFEPNIKKASVKCIALLENMLGMHSKFFTMQEIEKTITGLGFRILDKKEEGTSISLCFEKLE